MTKGIRKPSPIPLSYGTNCNKWNDTNQIPWMTHTLAKLYKRISQPRDKEAEIL